MKRKKWEPAVLMVLVLALGLWIAFGPAGRPKFDVHKGAPTQTLRIGNTRGLLEAFPAADGSGHQFRIWIADGPRPPRVLTREEAAALLGEKVVSNTVRMEGNPVFRALNITSWISVVWVGIGLLGQLAFSGRMVLQWIVSERKRESVITESFWWFSLFGAVTLFSYFVWRQDPIGILGQASGIVIYMRNLRLIYKQKRREARANIAAEADASGPAAADIEPKPGQHAVPSA